MAITIGQKQALMENLQLEITERARKLRAQYNVQAQGLKTRIEIRVNRIPISMRKKNIGDLFEKHNNTGAQAARNEVRPPVPPKNTQKKIPVEESESGSSTQSTTSSHISKRNSDEACLDKENKVDNPKKRQKAAPILPERTTSRVNMDPKQILSPRSANSRTLPASPIKPAPPAKSTTDSRPPTRTGRKIAPHTNPAGAARAKSASATSGPKTTRGRNVSNTSTDTVIVKKAPAAKVKKAAATQSIQPTQPASTAVGRVLRKRA
ncbi:hypothetical protein SS1G_08076 [Sclerotinia sclerotiorum 1980 UF-70]|uniref:Borealin N-terminal domain-containing protein n=2 Tax=Sclerotinia sclerotiorum (strain ATCC 18683 / 1980 / Ss-1) TaxID=665079 RepID=A7ERX1_SCLS1|nr:hypothetical protein SS1G_08076 [Sclerotinia sclerotiorum 1980 UF-70]APA13340.1 hypothetical protein sscle_11g081100 [Sclerotinia sclerotiorum 1980 UF-70]EDN92213.1 hypothetical protein SS1G_08076 [Sclerotinia sclerotiorum 1980 UF-70]